ncbi:hypothetical protein DICPUDRAFT_91085 [Dictyostelium purpureum]|uniref:CUE domain-containing protein n=1 Tax=Dictyostelium purpureum TaxID=5786 RepID=F0Z7D7_DICPU|nr:uncharacterized protein DICPUDRAFT_91085 [Dictyostelium purpureum]EGC40122.1 hypothetical protein DICPUDRAFT_91085 [Dictyostelium purpureum]|eukprot:XP_003283312.1 hypothetical protein DICPUDRAFT_91085 [Dictyostelium purpureum]
MESNISILKSMFPNSSAETIVASLQASNFDLDQAIDNMLIQSAAEEQRKKQEELERKLLVEQQKQQQPIPPPPMPQVESEEDKILKEFLFLEQQQKQQQPIPIPPPMPPKAQIVAPPPAHIPIPPPMPPKLEIVEEKEKSKDVGLLRNISNTLRELENEVKNLIMDPRKENKETIVIKEQVVVNPNENNNNEVVVNKHYSDNNNNNNNNSNDIKKDEIVVNPNPNNSNNEVVVNKHFEENNNNNNNNNENNSQKDESNIPNEVKVAIEQLNSIFNSSLEKTEKILSELKDEIQSWKIKDNVKTFTVSVRTELSEILSSLAIFISPSQEYQSVNTNEPQPIPTDLL